MKTHAFLPSFGGVRPRAAVRLPRAAAVLGAAALFACSRIGGDQVTSPVVVGMTETTPPAFQDGEDQVYEVHQAIQFPIRAPRADEANKRTQNDVYPAPLWLEAHDFQIELRYTLSNLTDQKQTIELLVDPWNEFVKYKPGLTMTQDNTIPDRSGYDRPWVLKPKEKLQGTITNDDTLEMAIDLGTVMNIQKVDTNAMDSLNALFNNTFDFQNRSSHPELDPLIAKYIPKIAPGLTGCDIGFRTKSAASVGLEVIVDIVDLKMDRVIAPGEERSKPALPPPAGVLTPPAAPAQ